MARNSDERNKFLEALKTTPFINRACKKIGVHRSTIYRWMEHNHDFRRAVELALEMGRENVVEAAESLVVKKIQEGDLGAAKFLLTHVSTRYQKQPQNVQDDLPWARQSQQEKIAKKKVTDDEIRRAFAGPDGNILVSEATIKYLRKKEMEREERKNRIFKPPGSKS